MCTACGLAWGSASELDGLWVWCGACNRWCASVLLAGRPQDGRGRKTHCMLLSDAPCTSCTHTLCRLACLLTMRSASPVHDRMMLLAVLRCEQALTGFYHWVSPQGISIPRMHHTCSPQGSGHAGHASSHSIVHCGWHAGPSVPHQVKQVCKDAPRRYHGACAGTSQEDIDALGDADWECPECASARHGPRLLPDSHPTLSSGARCPACSCTLQLLLRIVQRACSHSPASIAGILGHKCAS